MKKFIRVDIYRGIFSSKPLDTIYQIINEKKEKENVK